jgi:hypothetical protein
MPVPRPTRWASGIGMLAHRQAGAAVGGLTLRASGGGRLPEKLELLRVVGLQRLTPETTR